ncbi:putative membrane protein [Salmonella phage vB_SalM_SA002]|nr:putative membrane protein [Salmonella phage vB_SalM_SA002]
MSRYESEGLEAGSWGEFFAALEHMTVRMQSARFNGHEMAKSLLTPLQASVVSSYNSAIAKLIAHTTDYTDTHSVDRETLNLGLVDNNDIATLQQIADGGYDDLYIGSDGFSALAAKVFGDFADRLHHQTINPISVYGDVSWLPPDVSGSFEGSGQASGGNAGGFALIEDDGTYIGLRRGTNGTSQGLYYFYQSNAEDRIDTDGPVRMNLRYAPANRPGGFECLETISSDVDVIVGSGYGNGTYDGFISLTNGTMDVSKHYTGYFNINGSFGRGFDTFSSACVAGNYVYLFIPTIAGAWDYSGEVLDPYDFLVFRCPTSQIIAGGVVTWEAVTNWNSTGLWGGTGVAANIRVTPTIISGNTANKPFIKHESRSWTTTYSPVHSGRRTMCCANPTNANQIRLAVYHTVWTSLANGTAVMPNVAFSLLINLSAKTAVVEDGATYINHVSPNQNSVTLQSPIVMPDATKITGFNWTGNYHVNTLITARGYMLSRGTGNQPDENNRYFRAQITNFVNRYDALRMRNRVIRPITTANDPMRTGSAFTNGSMNPRMLPGLYLMYNGTAVSGSNQFWYGRAKRLQFIGGPTFNYGTINSGVIKGWAPNGTRIEFTDDINFNQAVFISRAASDGSLVCDASVAYGPQTHTNTGGTSINKDLVISGSINWSATEGNNLAITILRQILARTNIYAYAWTLYIPQDANLPLIMMVSGSTARDDSVGFRSTIVFTELNYTGSRSGAITGYSLKRVVNSVVYDKMPGGAYLQYETMGGLQTYKCADGTYLLSVGCPAVLQTYGGQTGQIWYAAVRAGTKTIEDATVKRYDHGYYPMSANPSGFVHPSYGLCKMDYATNQANYNAILTVDVMASTYAEFLTWQPKTKYVLGAQEVEKGWVVYFTADAPVFLAGREWTLPATSIDLRNVNASPGNKTFYVYVRLTTTGIEYFITTDTLAPTMTMMYIGKIVTIATQISTIEITKKIRVETFELSPVHIGSGIPTGVGVPSQVGDFKGWINPSYKFNNRQYFRFDAVADLGFIYSINIKTGLVTMQHSRSAYNYSYNQTDMVTGATWNPGFNYDGPTDETAHNTYNTWSRTMPGIAIPVIDEAKSVSAARVHIRGRSGSSLVQQPTAANGWVLRITGSDAPGDSDRYTIDVYLTVNW